MIWLSLIKGLLSVAQLFMKRAADKQLLDAGEAKNVVRALQHSQKVIAAAQLSRASVKHDADSVRDDRDNRDSTD